MKSSLCARWDSECVLSAHRSARGSSCPRLGLWILKLASCLLSLRPGVYPKSLDWEGFSGTRGLKLEILRNLVLWFLNSKVTGSSGSGTHQ